jgi:DNA replication protein DnaC
VLPLDLYAAEWKVAAVSASSSFESVAASDMPINPIVWLVHDYLEQSALAVLFGPPGKGKSFLALDLACCVATGIEVLVAASGL